MIDNSKKILEVSHLKTYFKVGTGKRKLKVKAVDDISFHVNQGEVLGIVGESGCGKTTTARTIVRLYRPTDGTIKFDGEIIGSGHNEFYRLLKYEHIEYQKKKLQLNSRKYLISQINEKYDEKINELKKTIEKNQKECQEKIASLSVEKNNYDKQLFQIQSNYSLQKEISLVNYINQKKALYNQTINEYKVELKDAIKSTKFILNQKNSGIKSSAGLDKEGKDQQLKMANEKYLHEIAELEKNYTPKIEERSKNLLSKEKYKEQLLLIKQEYENNVQKREEDYQKKLTSLAAPVNSSDDNTVLEYKDALNAKNLKLIKEIENLRVQRKNELSTVPKETKIDHAALEKLKKEHREFVRQQYQNIKLSKSEHYNSDAKLVHEKIQMIYQDPISSLNPRMTVQEIIAEGLIIKGVKDKAFLDKKVAEALSLVGLPADFASRYPHEFSGGQRQRIGIARALIMESKFIIADEPISALDVSIRAQVINLLTELREKLDLTILFVAHDLSVVRFFCDRIVVMYAGKIIEMGDTEEIFKNPLHPYTKSLLSAIPQPDPDSEKTRQRTIYNPHLHSYATDIPTLKEVTPNHSVYVNNEEFELIKKELKNEN